MIRTIIFLSFLLLVTLIFFSETITLSKLLPKSISLPQTFSWKFSTNLICDKNLWSGSHCVKSVRIQSYSGPHFPAFELNTERYSVSLHIQPKCGKMRC